MHDENVSRRKFLKSLAVVLPAGAVLLNRESQSADLVTA